MFKVIQEARGCLVLRSKKPTHITVDKTGLVVNTVGAAYRVKAQQSSSESPLNKRASRHAASSNTFTTIVASTKAVSAQLPALRPYFIDLDILLSYNPELSKKSITNPILSRISMANQQGQGWYLYGHQPGVYNPAAWPWAQPGQPQIQQPQQPQNYHNTISPSATSQPINIP